MGANGIRGEEPGDVRDALTEALAHRDGPVVVDAVVDPLALSLPSHVPFHAAKGFTLTLAKQSLEWPPGHRDQNNKTQCSFGVSEGGYVSNLRPEAHERSHRLWIAQHPAALLELRFLLFIAGRESGIGTRSGFVLPDHPWHSGRRTATRSRGGEFSTIRVSHRQLYKSISPS